MPLPRGSALGMARPTYVITPAIFEATHGTAPKTCGASIGSIPASREPLGVMMLEFNGLAGGRPTYHNAASTAAIASGQVTYDSRLMEAHGWSR